LFLFEFPELNEQKQWNNKANSKEYRENQKNTYKLVASFAEKLRISVNVSLAANLHARKRTNKHFSNTRLEIKEQELHAHPDIPGIPLEVLRLEIKRRCSGIFF